MALQVRPKQIKPTGSMIGGLPTYTPAQLQIAQPGAKWANYLNFINRRRGVRPGPAWPGRGGPGLPTIESMIRQVQIESPAQLQARQNQIVASQVAAQKGLLSSGYTNEAALAQQAHRQALGEALRTMQAQSAAGRAATALNTDLFGMVGGQYNAGAQELAGLATGGVSDVADQTAANTAATNQALAAVGMPGIDSRLAGPEQASVARFRAGLGAQNLVNQGEAANFGLAGQINAQNLRATQEAVAGQNQTDRTAGTDLTNALAQAQRTRSAGLQQIALQRPDLAAKTLQQLQDANRQQIALGSTLLQQRRAALQAGFNQSLSIKQLHQQKKISDAQIKAATSKAANKTSLPNSQLSRTVGALVDATGAYIPDAKGNPIILPGFKFDPKTGQIVKTYKPNVPKGKKGTAGGVTAGEIQSFLKGLKTPTYVTQTTRAPVEGGQKGQTQSVSQKIEGKPRFSMKFKQAYQRLRTWGGLDDAEARQYLQTVYQRGEQGRDWLTNEEQAALAQAPADRPLPGGVAGPTRGKPSIHAGQYKDKQGWHGYLTQRQASILKQAGLLPDGEQGTIKRGTVPVWFIHPGA